MQAVRRLAGGGPGVIADAGIGIAAAGLTAVAAWGPPGPVGAPIAAPSWLLALLPLLMWLALWAGLVFLFLHVGDLPQGLEFTFALFAACPVPKPVHRR